MVSWLLGIGKCLKSTNISSVTDNGRLMCSVLLILHVLFKVKHYVHSVNPHEVAFLFTMLCLRPDISSHLNHKCLDLTFLTSNIPQEYHVKIVDELIFFTNQMLPVASLNLEWICVIPLIHIFSKRIEPFDLPVFTSNEIQWRDKCLVSKINSLNFPR